MLNKYYKLLGVHENSTDEEIKDVYLSLRKKYDINVVAIRNNDKISTTVDPSIPLEKGMELIVIANTLKLQKLK